MDRNFDDAVVELRKLFIDNVQRKLNPERDFGFLLSGGLDSSLVCSVATSLLKNRIRTFTGGFSGDFSGGKDNAPDIIAARIVAKHIGSIHTEYIFTPAEGIAILPEVIRNNETWDQTSVRASVIMTLLLRAIKRDHPEMAVIYSGEVADELFMGYLEWQNAPNSKAARNHVIKRLQDITYFDGLRADRTISAVGCELRTPFFGKDLLNFVLSCPPEWFMHNFSLYKKGRNVEKYMLRKAFDTFSSSEKPFLPDEILWRTKHAFSDATSIVGANSWKEQLKAHAEREVTDSRFSVRSIIYLGSNIPQTKEDMLYREIFETFGYEAKCIPYKWLPEWAPAELTDASATALSGFVESAL
jgi:asparagine synthase (glutamine-hydrolysing)